MRNRVFERVLDKLRVDLYYDNQIYEGTVTNLSRSGLGIDAEICPPPGSHLEVVLVLGDESFQLPGKVRRRISTNELKSSMGVELSDTSESFCKFISVIQDYSCS